MRLHEIKNKKVCPEEHFRFEEKKYVYNEMGYTPCLIPTPHDQINTV